MIGLEEAIKHCEEVAEEQEREAEILEYSKLDWKCEANQCLECAKEHRQLAEWLKELKAYRDGCKCESCIHNEKAHDEYPCYMCVGSELWTFNGGKS